MHAQATPPKSAAFGTSPGARTACRPRATGRLLLRLGAPLFLTASRAMAGGNSAAAAGHGEGAGEARAEAVREPCQISGRAAVASGTTLWDSEAGGKPIASFLGRLVSLRVQPGAAPSGASRSAVSAGDGLRLAGFVENRALPLYAARRIPLVEGHVWIREGARMELVGRGPDGVRVDLRLQQPLHQVERLTVACTDLTATQPRAQAAALTGSRRGYLPRAPSLVLYDRPRGREVFSVHASDFTTGPLFLRADARGGYVHLSYEEDLVVDAWARAKDVVPLKAGELLDRPAPTEMSSIGARLVSSGETSIARARSSTEVFLSTQERALPFGELEENAEVYVVQTVLGWSRVLPRDLNLVPPEGLSFWVRASDLVLVSPKDTP